MPGDFDLITIRRVVKNRSDSSLEFIENLINFFKIVNNVLCPI